MRDCHAARERSGSDAKSATARGVMAGYKGKGDARAQSKRANGPGPISSMDDLARRLGVRPQNDLSIQEVLAQLCASPALMSSSSNA